MRKAVLLIILLVAACVTVRKLEIAPVEYEATGPTPTVVKTPVKAHLQDGSTVVFPQGMTVQYGKITGQGFKYDIALIESEPVTEIPIEELAAMESYRTPVDSAKTTGATVVVAVGGTVGSLALLKALFGSCPTTYSLEGDEPVLEAESFSYSIAPGFEARDVDRLGVDVGDARLLELEMRNEALETHYINHVELLEVAHAMDEQVYPGPDGEPLAVRNLMPPRASSDSSGRDVLAWLGETDGKAWRSEAARLKQVSLDNLHDHVELEFPAQALAGDSVLVLRMRNSLLNTVLLYDVMLDAQGFRALDWMGQDLDRLIPKLRLGHWYNSRMGMRVSIWDGDDFREIVHLADTGPIAWHEVAVPLPEVAGEVLRVRLSFVADNWRIDSAALGHLGSEVTARAVAVSSVTSLETTPIEGAARNLAAVDDSYVETRPGSAMRLGFDLGEAPKGLARTYFLAAEGYYIEWLRREWLERSSAEPFQPRDEALVTAMQIWETSREAYRERFDATRIPVR